MPPAPVVPPPPTQKVVISQAEWDRRMAAAPVTKTDLNRLIMDYLVIEGYKSAAEEFSREAEISPAPDFESIQSRMGIREAVQRGDVQEAIERVNDLNPEILDTNPTLYFHLQQQRLIEFIRAGNIGEALQFAQTELAPRVEENPQFLAELEKTMALLMFEAPSAASATGTGTAELLTPAQRSRTAGELNAAILESLSQGREAKLIGLVRLLGWGEMMLSKRAEFPKLELGAGGRV